MANKENEKKDASILLLNVNKKPLRENVKSKFLALNLLKPPLDVLVQPATKIQKIVRHVPEGQLNEVQQITAKPVINSQMLQFAQFGKLPLKQQVNNIVPYAQVNALVPRSKPVTVTATTATATAAAAATTTGTAKVYSCTSSVPRLNLIQVDKLAPVTRPPQNTLEPPLLNVKFLRNSMPSKLNTSSLLMPAAQCSTAHLPKVCLNFIPEPSAAVSGSLVNVPVGGGQINEEVCTNSPTLDCHVDREAMTLRLTRAYGRFGLQTPADEALDTLCLALQNYLKGILEQVVIFADHRLNSGKINPELHKITNDVYSKLAFFNEVDKLLEASEAERLCNRNQEEKRVLKFNKAEAAQLKNANQTALAAIGPRRKKASVETPIVKTETAKVTKISPFDLIFYMENNRRFCKSDLLFKAYLKYR